MPQVFREAVLVARKLRLWHIWIDALCIVQDDTEDWENESVQMPDIFAHSFVTIGAAAASSCHDNFLKTQSPFHFSQLSTQKSQDNILFIVWKENTSSQKH